MVFMGDDGSLVGQLFIGARSGIVDPTRRRLAPVIGTPSGTEPRSLVGRHERDSVAFIGDGMGAEADEPSTLLEIGSKGFDLGGPLLRASS
jgi:hypothetical protein